MSTPPTAADFVEARRRMIESLIASREVTDTRVLAAMSEIPREEFLKNDLGGYAYADSPLPIDAGQTISQPLVVAWMAQELELRPDDRVLEVGAGSGYAAAVLGRITGSVFAVERHPGLAALAAERLSRLGITNVRVRQGDGTLGWPEEGSFDAISVAAAGPDVPRSLLDQLAPGGRLLVPIGADPRTQRLLRIRRDTSGRLHREDLGGVRFVSLVGAEGFPEDPPPRAAATAASPPADPSADVAPTAAVMDAGSVGVGSDATV